MGGTGVEVFGIIGMTFGMTGMVFAINALSKVQKLEKDLKEAGVLDSTQ